MGIADRLTDPWGLVAGGVSGGLAGATAAALAGFGVGVPVALAVAGAVWGVKVGLDALADRRARPSRPRRTAADDPPRPPRGSPAESWLQRAERAVATLHDLTESPAHGPVRERVADVDDRAADTLADLRRLAAQITAVENAARRIDVRQLHADAERLRRGVATAADPDLRAEQERAAAAVAEQLAVHGRMRVGADTLLARMETTALGLERLIARLAEVLALTATTGTLGTATERLDDLADELGGMREGLRESEALSRQVLASGGGPGREGPADHPGARGDVGRRDGAGAA